MKNFLKTGIIVCMLVLAATSCRKENEGENLVDFSLKILLPPDFDADASYNGNVTMTNTSTGRNYTVKAIDGKASFSALYQGVYNIDVTQTLTQAEFSAMAPELGNSATSYTLKGSMKGVLIATGSAGSAEITLNWFAESSLLISKIYGNGTFKNTGKIQNMPKYWEIYNNSDEVVYLDGLCFAQAHGNTVGPGPCELHTLYQNQATYAARIATFPGTHGATQDIPLQPGKSVVIAWNASNFIVTDQPEEQDNCTMNVDLSDADYEIYQGEAYAWNMYGDNVNVPNITPVHECIPSAGFLQMNQAVFIFYATPQEVDSWATGTDGTSYTVESQKNWIAKRVPNEIIIDAVETLKSEANQHRRIPDILDSYGVESMNNKGIVFVRKIRLITEDGRKVLMDTNNSKNDFAAIGSRDADNFDAWHLVPRNYDHQEIQPAP